jgi:hypothetical protein
MLGGKAFQPPLVVHENATGDQAVLPIHHLLEGLGMVCAKCHVLHRQTQKNTLRFFDSTTF